MDATEILSRFESTQEDDEDNEIIQAPDTEYTALEDADAKTSRHRKSKAIVESPITPAVATSISDSLRGFSQSSDFLKILTKMKLHI